MIFMESNIWKLTILFLLKKVDYDIYICYCYNSNWSGKQLAIHYKD